MDRIEDIVVTGVGATTPIGIGAEAVWDSLQRGVSGVRMLDYLRDAGLPVPIGADLADYEPKQHVRPRKSVKLMSREVQIGFAAATLAVEDAGLDTEAVDPDRFGVVYGAEMMYCTPEELADVFCKCTDESGFRMDLWGRRAMSDIFPLWMLKYLPNMIACHLGIAFDARGPNNTLTVGEVSGLLAVIEAADVIRRGMADVMIVGSAGNRLNFSSVVSRSTDNLSHRFDAPQQASRPFDADRDGMINGEGAGAIVLERAAHAQQRKADVIAHLRGYGRSFQPRDNGGPAAPDGVQRAIRAALRQARIEPGRIDHVNAHGLSTVSDDAAEAEAISQTLGDVPVTAPKSYFGNLGAGAGIAELAVSLLAVRHGSVPPTLNYQRPDPACPVTVIHGQSRSMRGEAFMKLNHSGTGQAAALLFSRS